MTTGQGRGGGGDAVPHRTADGPGRKKRRTACAALNRAVAYRCWEPSDAPKIPARQSRRYGSVQLALCLGFALHNAVKFCGEDMGRNETCIEEIQSRYVRVFASDSDYIPLIVSPPCPDQASREEWQEQPEMAVRKTAAALAPKVAVGSDWIPSVNMGWFQCIVVPSFFGARPAFTIGSDPIVEPCFRNVHEAVQAGRPSAGGPVLEHMLSVLDTSLRGLPAGFALSFPPTASPFDLAQLLLPADEFLVSLVTEPDETSQCGYPLDSGSPHM